MAPKKPKRRLQARFNLHIYPTRSLKKKFAEVTVMPELVRSSDPWNLVQETLVSSKVL